MKRLIVKSLSNISSHFNLRENFGLRVLNYHSIGGMAFNDSKGYFSLPSKLFEDQIKFIASNYYNNLISLNNVKIPKRKLNIGLSFDDGYLDNLKVAAPILLKYSVPVTLFVSTNFIKNKVKGFLSPHDLKEFSKLPKITIGSHGSSHIDLTKCKLDKIKNEIIDSQLYLEDLLGKEITLFSYPFGKYNQVVLEALLDSTYHFAYTTKFDINKFNSNPFRLSRFNIEADNSIKILNQKIQGDWDWYRYRDLL